MDYQLLFAVLGGIAVLLFLILRLKIHAFLSLLIASILVGVFAGMDPKLILESVRSGMGGTLGFVATVVGLGSLFGAILEYSGGAQRLAHYFLSKYGEQKAPWTIMITGFLVAIPVFFDVAFIILMPLVYALQRRTKKSLLLYALPLLAGLAITHAFIPPTPGPIAVAEILNADLGWVILMGFLCGIPTAIIAGPFWAKIISKKIVVQAPEETEDVEEVVNPPSARLIFSIIFLPILFIVTQTLLTSPLAASWELPVVILYIVNLLGHPFTALIVANLVAWYMLGIRRGVQKDTLIKISGKSLYPAGSIILLTGAGAAFKQILIDTGAGKMIAESLSSEYFPTVVFGFIVAALVRVLQGSSTVAMITGAGITAPLLSDVSLSNPKTAVLVIAIAAGASIFSHVNDSGFWLVKEYLGLTEKQTFKSWTVLTVLLAGTGLISSLILWYIV